MEPTFHENDFIIVDKLTPRFWELERWDVIVFVPEGKDVPYIKRIIGMPWETVFVKDNWFTICSGNVTSISQTCSRLSEPYIPSDFITQAKNNKDIFYIATGYFTVWDHRWYSTDSLSCFGLWCYGNAIYTARPQNIIGKVLVRVFPNFSTNF